jgi:hypothetical protein
MMLDLNAILACCAHRVTVALMPVKARALSGLRLTAVLMQPDLGRALAIDVARHSGGVRAACRWHPKSAINIFVSPGVPAPFAGGTRNLLWFCSSWKQIPDRRVEASGMAK